MGPNKYLDLPYTDMMGNNEKSVVRFVHMKGISDTFCCSLH